MRNLVLGCMNFGRRTPVAEAERVLAAALDAGVTQFDTANVYAEGESERIVGNALDGRVVTVTTKVGLARAGRAPEGLHPDTLRAACEQSLRRLRREQVDVYLLHAPDPHTPGEATVEAIGELLHAGKIAAWGVSNFAAWQVLELITLADRAGVPRPAVGQQLYNVLVRQLELEYFAFAQRYGLVTTVYNPLAGGLLARAPTGAPPDGARFRNNPLYQRRYATPPMMDAAAGLAAIATDHGLSLLELAYAFVFHRTEVHAVVIGPATEVHLHAALAAARAAPPTAALAAVETWWRARAGTDAKYAR
ncbi:MAG: aldo/keto reductase [Myxococcales bacterium]|nr:aldo/keto reductase [Myxococcales bacterium]